MLTCYSIGIFLVSNQTNLSIAIFKKIRIRFFLWLKKKLGIIRPPIVIPYRGYANDQEIFVAGHVLENRPEFLAEEGDKKRKNFRNMIARYMSTSLPDTHVNIQVLGQSFTVVTDELGYFSKTLEVNEPLKPGWFEINYAINDDNGEECFKATGDILVHNHKASFGVISDIDDTVLISHATQLFRKLRLILTKNAKTRLPFAGVRDFYCALAGDDSINPIFYVSSSEWNLYDFLVDFFETRGLPKGPFLLQQFKEGLNELIKSGGGTHMHKQEKIETLMTFYPHLSFVLIGDSGQRDPEIYAEIVKKYPGRVKAIYIRAIGKDKKLDQQVLDIIKNADVPILLLAHTGEAYKHARSIGLLSNSF
ncbi:App1 family protein [Ekhidna sp.]|uniref:App1 family protein n=1 Tax=Ekhidna sp. TaxID=2608089 RepID=UPI003CCB8D93